MKKVPMSGQSGASRTNAGYKKPADGGQSGGARSAARQGADRGAGKKKATPDGPGVIDSLEKLRAVAKGKMIETVEGAPEKAMAKSKKTMEGMTPSGQPRKQVKLED